MRAVVLLALLAASAAGCADDAGIRATAPAPAPPRTVPADRVLSRTYMGVSCPRPNRIECNRVGLAVWLRHPAQRVEAEIDGRRFALDDPDWSLPERAGRRRMFAGFLRRAGLTEPGAELAVEADDGPRSRWIETKAIEARVRLWITRDQRRVQQTELDVVLAPGWG